MGEPGRAAAVAGWWRDLSGAWRANVGLYALATVALLALLVQIVVGGGSPPQKVEVASRAPGTTKALSAPKLLPSTTAVPPTTTALAPPATSPAPAPGTTAPVTAAPAPPAADPPAATPDPTVPAPICGNSTDPACGAFYWDPAPAPNRPLTVSVSSSSATPTTADTVTFTVTVTDPDHLVSDNCAVADYGDGVVEPRGCAQAECANAHGPWAPPPATGESRGFTFTHRYSQANPYSPTFTFRTDFDPPCPSPYGSSGSGATVVSVKPAP